MYQFNRAGIEENTVFENNDFPFNIFEIHGYRMRAHWHNHLELIYARKGMNIIGLNDSKVKLDEGEFILIFGGTVHSIQNHGGIYEAFLIGDELFKDLLYDKDYGTIIRQLFNVGHLTHKLFRATEPSYDLLQSQIEIVKEEFNWKSTGYRMMIKSILSGFILTVARNLPAGEGVPIKVNSTIDYIKKAIDYVDHHYNDKITLKDLSQVTHLSEQYFSRVFKSYTNKTFIEYLTLYRLEMSEWYLKHTDMPITSIPNHIGFCNANYYARTYKEHFHQTPSETRRKYLNESKELSTN